MNDLITKIGDSIRWYDRIPPGFNDIRMLLNARRVLATRLYMLSGYMADMNRDKIAAEHIRKSFEAKRFAELRDKSEGKVIASHIEASVRAESVEYCRKEAETEADFAAAKLIYSAALNVCDVMNQHISNLKQEIRAEYAGTGSQ